MECAYVVTSEFSIKRRILDIGDSAVHTRIILPRANALGNNSFVNPLNTDIIISNNTLLVKCWTLGGERERVRVYIYVYVYIRAQAAQAQKHIAQHIEPVFFPGPSGFEDCAFCLSSLASSTSLPFLLSTSFQSRLTVPFLLCLH